MTTDCDSLEGKMAALNKSTRDCIQKQTESVVSVKIINLYSHALSASALYKMVMLFFGMSVVLVDTCGYLIVVLSRKEARTRRVELRVISKAVLFCIRVTPCFV